MNAASEEHNANWLNDLKDMKIAIVGDEEDRNDFLGTPAIVVGSFEIQMRPHRSSIPNF